MPNNGRARRVEPYVAQFDELDRSGHRFTLGLESRDREPDGSIPPHAWFRGEEYELETEADDEVTVYIRRL